MTWMIVIIIALTIFLTGIIVISAQMFGGENSRKKGSSGGGHVIADGGVDAKDKHFGKKKGADFKAGNKMYGTVISRNGQVHHMWNVYFNFLDSGRREIVIFGTKMAIGRKAESMKAWPYLAIPEDSLVSSIHCYLLSTMEGLAVKDAESLNHTYVNGQRIDERCLLKNGSILRVGRTKIRVTFEYR